MEKGSQETSAEPVQLSLTDENISQADYERLRSGEKVEVEKSAPAPTKVVQSETADESETSETDGDEVEDTESDETLEMRPKKKSGTQRRIEKLVKQRAEAEREREYWRQEALKHSAPKQEQTPEPVIAKPSVDDKPTPDSFETHQEYVEALTDWKLEQRDKQREMKAKEAELKTEFQKRVQSHTERVKAFTEKHEDFTELMSEVDDVPLSLTVQEVILASDNGPELMYELAKDRKEFERICQLPAIEAARALGRLEAKLQKPSEEKQVSKPKTTKAPPPARPISTSSANGKKSVYDDDISQSEYERIRSEQEKRRASIY